MSGPRGIVALVDCGGANIASLRFALRRLGAEAKFTREAAEIESADKVFLPGWARQAPAWPSCAKPASTR